MDTIEYDPEVRALAQHTGDDPEDFDSDGLFWNVGRRSYLVLSDEAATEAVTENIAESLWCFRAEFLSDFMADGVTPEHIEKIASALYDDANPFFRALIGDRFGKFVSKAIASDGRGHFLAGYDGKENEATVDGTTYYIYRVN